MTLTVLCLAGLFSMALALGAVLTAYALLTHYQTCYIQKWPTTQGKITAVSVQQETRTDQENRSIVVYYPEVQYTYTVEGVTYTASRINPWPRPGYSTAQKAQRDLKGYQPGHEVLVYYDPQDPTKAFLEPAPKHNRRWLLAGVFLLVLAFGVLLPIVINLAHAG